MIATGMASSNRAQQLRNGDRRVFIPSRIAAPPRFSALRQLVVHELSGETMGTFWRAKLSLEPRFDVEGLRRKIVALLDGLVSEMSQWEPSSDLSRFNSARPDSWHSIPASFFHVLSSALSWAERTGGAYDPTIGNAVDLWGFGPGGGIANPPPSTQVDAFRAGYGWQRIKLDKDNRRALQPGGVALDLCGIAKGFAVDAVALLLRQSGVSNFLIEIGGELRGEGFKPDGAPWWVQFPEPHRETSAEYGGAPCVLALCGMTVATSGDEFRHFMHEGQRLSHTLDPRTGRPVENGVASVTVVADTCMDADALATALTVLGVERGLEFATANGVAARFLSFNGECTSEHLSPALLALED